MLGVGQCPCETEKGRFHALTSMQKLADIAMGLANKKTRPGASQKTGFIFVKNRFPPEKRASSSRRTKPTWLGMLPHHMVVLVTPFSVLCSLRYGRLCQEASQYQRRWQSR